MASDKWLGLGEEDMVQEDTGCCTVAGPVLQTEAPARQERYKFEPTGDVITSHQVLLRLQEKWQ